MTKLKNWDTCIGLETSRVGWGVRGGGGGGRAPMVLERAVATYPLPPPLINLPTSHNFFSFCVKQ